MDPIDPSPSHPLFQSYTYQTPISDYTRERYLAADTLPEAAPPLVEDEREAGSSRVRWIMGIDEAGRGPVLGEVAGVSSRDGPPADRFRTRLSLSAGPMVYAAAFCPMSFSSTLEDLGFDDSKALSHATRDHLFSLFSNPPGAPEAKDADGGEEQIKSYHELHYATRVLSPADISRDMTRGVAPVNLNKQAEEATISLIAGVMKNGIDIAEVSPRTVPF